MQSLENLAFLVKTTVKFRNLQTTYQQNSSHQYKHNFSNSIQGYVHVFEVYKNNFAVNRSRYFYVENHKFSLTNTFVFFLIKGTFPKYKKKNNNPLLLKSTFKYQYICKYFGSKYGVIKISTYLYGRQCFITTFPITSHVKTTVI